MKSDRHTEKRRGRKSNIMMESIKKLRDSKGKVGNAK